MVLEKCKQIQKLSVLLGKFKGPQKKDLYEQLNKLFGNF